MRTPPAKGLAGSAVWQLAQSPASTSALPWAIVSADGSAARVGTSVNALHKIDRPRRIARIAKPSLARPYAVTGISKNRPDNEALRHFVPSPRDDTNRKRSRLFQP